QQLLAKSVPADGGCDGQLLSASAGFALCARLQQQQKKGWSLSSDTSRNKILPETALHGQRATSYGSQSTQTLRTCAEVQVLHPGQQVAQDALLFAVVTRPLLRAGVGLMEAV